MRDPLREQYYRHRAPVYDVTSYRGDDVVNAGLDQETADIGKLLAALPEGRALDVGCGTGVWTQFLRGPVIALDQSAEMLGLTRARVPHAQPVQGLFPPLPFVDGAFDRIVTANFYGLLRPAERTAFLAEARRTAGELVVIDLRSDGDLHEEKIELRTVAETTYPIFRRRFTPESLRAELVGELMYCGRYFLAVRV
ncbi:class I SAM-dependent methyltransferase [Streptomyces sp. NBC_01408]|uniref:class I SAM-dependent methyltransferase n=1 Tax=Streptomyces sp. NBC_01408 TaxID=2903855 RepID=UPI0022546C07|nr:class I SAM-dependent methyltransferase [Streptomyces sp. NBC_01408]MCX4692380.1 class I SAM-dependent methyltransferase [Streptomyces sp. NBC_01408]